MRSTSAGDHVVQKNNVLHYAVARLCMRFGRCLCSLLRMHLNSTIAHSGTSLPMVRKQWVPLGVLVCGVVQG